MKKAIYIIIAIIIVWFGVRFFVNESLAPESNIIDNNHELTLSVETKNTSESNDEKRYDINIDLPIVKNLDGSEKVNEFIEEKVNNIVQEFKDNINDWDAPSDLSDMSSGLWINFETHLLNSDYISFRLVISEYYLGAAHPNNYSFSLNYNLKNSSEIKLNDIFNVNQKEYLSRISDLALIDLANQSENLEMSLDPGMLESGTDAKLENFDNFNLTEDGIAFNFDQYQLAPYAAGEFHVIMPYQKLNDIMLNEFIL